MLIRVGCQANVDDLVGVAVKLVVEKAIIDFEATLKCPNNVKLGGSTALFMSH